MIGNPAAYFDTGACDKALSGPLNRVWPDLARFVDRGLEVFSPPPGTSPRAQAKAALLLGLDLTERLIIARAKDQKKTSPQIEPILTTARSFLTAAVDGNVPELIVAVGNLIQVWVGSGTEQDAHVRKGLQLVSAITAYASSYTADAKGNEKQLHEARKRAIENLIDAAANRSERHGEWVFSVGANVGASLIGGQYLPAQSSFQVAYSQIVLPLGVSAQWLPQGKQCGPGKLQCTRYLGFHAQISPIDLGQFVSYDGNFQITSTRWSNFVTASAQIAMLLGKPASPFVLGLDLRYSPTLFSQEQAPGADGGSGIDRGGMFRFGLYFGYYVPFFDFN